MLHNITSLRLLLVLASLSALGKEVEAATREQLVGSRALAARHVASRTKELPGMARLYRKTARYSKRGLTKRRRYDDDDYEEEDEQEYDNAEEEEFEASPVRQSAARSFITSEERDERTRRASDFTTDDYGNRARAEPLESDDFESDSVEEDQDGSIRIKPARVDPSSASSLSPSISSSAISNPKARLSEAIMSSALPTSTDLLRSSTSMARAESSSSLPSSSAVASLTSSSSSTAAPAQPTRSPNLVTSTVTADDVATDSNESESAEPTPTKQENRAEVTDDRGNADSDVDDESSAPLTSIWSAFDKGNKWFPVAIILTILIAIAALVIAVALLQCIARSSRFSKKGSTKERPLLIPTDSSWGGSESSRRSSLLSVQEKQGGPIASVPASRRASSIGGRSAAYRQENNDHFTSFPSTTSRPRAPSHRRSSTSAASLYKEDFLPHSYDPDPEMNVADIYPALARRSQSQTTFNQAYSSPPSRRQTPAPAVWPYPQTVPTLQRIEPAAYPYSASHNSFSGPSGHYRMPSTSYSPRAPRLPSLPQIPQIGTPSILTPGARSSSPAMQYSVDSNGNMSMRARRHSCP